MRHLAFVILLAASPAFACCPKDTDTLLEECGDNIDALDVIAGKVTRFPDAWYEAKLQQAEGPLERAEWLDMLNRQDEALDELAALETEGPERNKLAETRFRLALHLWWRGGAGQYDTDRCLEIATKARESEPTSVFLDRLLNWMKLESRADPQSLHPDMFNLRMMTNKKSSTATGQLSDAGLRGLDAQLLALIQLHPVWENFDTLYALSLAYTVEGKQNLAYYARLRAWELNDNGRVSRVPGSEQIEDIRQVTVVREYIDTGFRVVQLVTDENMARIENQYKARRAYAPKWQEVLREHALQTLEQGSTLTDFSFWESFEAPESSVPPLYDPPEPEPAQTEKSKDTNGQPAQAESVGESTEEKAEEDKPRGGTWIMLGVLVGMLGLGIFMKARIDRSAQQVLDDAEKPGEES